MGKQNDSLVRETAKLAGALSKSQTRGQYGEAQLEMLLEGADLKEGIPTLVTLSVITENDPADKELISRLVKPINDEDLPQVIQELRTHKVMEKVKAYLAKIATEANDLLIDLPECAAKDALKNLTLALVSRST